MNAFETWWYTEGSASPKPGEDIEEHCKRMCQIAWSNGAYMERESQNTCANQKTEQEKS